MFDGCGFHHPYITLIAQDYLNSCLNNETPGGSAASPTSILWRAPYLKGVTHELNYVDFYAERGIDAITDIWGVSHGVTEYDEPLVVMFESMYKGLKYFCRTNTSDDWAEYWRQFEKYNHCMGVAKWNFSLEEEPAYTRANYQIIQDLRLNYDRFGQIAKKTAEWVEKIVGGDEVYTYCFLGLFADRSKPIDCYARAVMKNPEMLNEECVRKHLINLVSRKIDEMKCGKLYVKGAFKFVAPDLVMAMEYVGGLEPVGCLNADEFYSRDCGGSILGERLIERNPHICHSEHTILTGADNELRRRYCPNLINVCMVNAKSLVMQKLQGADADGDLVFVIDDETIMSGVDRDSVIVMDADDKITVEKERDTPENRLKVTVRTMKNLIGEYSNYSCVYHNKTPRTPEQRAKYDRYIEIISILTGKSID